MSATNKTVAVDLSKAHESNVPRILGLGVTFYGLAFIVFSLRMYTRAVVVRNFGKDDILMVLCMLGLTGGLITIIIAVANGLGRHAFVLKPDQIITYGKTVFTQALLTTVTSLCLLKLSVAVSLLRLAGPSSGMNKWYRYVIWGLMVFICLYMVESWISILAYCDPVAAHWDKKLLPTAKCWPIEVFRFFPLFNTACNILTDVLFATLPIPIIWRLQMKRRTRIYLVGVFSLGWIAVFIGVAKAVSQVKFRGDPEAVYHNWTQTLGFLQQNIGVVAACAPTLKPLVGRWLKLSGSEYPSNGYRDNSKKYGLSSGKSNKSPSSRDDGEAGFEMSPSAAQGYKPTRSFHQATVKSGPSPTSSEERIISNNWNRDEKNGVMKTTEISVS